MIGDLTKRNQNLYCHYYQEPRHIMEDCRNLWDYLDQLVQEGKPKSLLHHSRGQGNQTSLDSWKNAPSGSSLRTINVIFAALGRTGSCPTRVMSVARLSADEGSLEPKRAKILTQSTLGFSDEGKAETI